MLILHRRVAVPDDTYGSEPTSDLQRLCPVLTSVWDAESSSPLLGREPTVASVRA
jgi:hypothetical protein